MKNNTKNDFTQKIKQFLDNKDQANLQGLLVLLKKLSVGKNTDEIEFQKLDLIKKFISIPKDKEEGINIDNLLEILSASELTGYETKLYILSYFIESPFNQINSVTDFCELLNKIAIPDKNNDNSKETLNIIKQFLNTERNIKIDVSDIKVILNLSGKAQRSEIAGLIFGKNQKLIPADFFSFNNLKNLLESNQENVNNFSDNERVIFIKSFLGNKNTKITIDKFLQIIDTVNNIFATKEDKKEGIKSKIDIISAFLSNNNNIINISDFNKILEKSIGNEKEFITQRLDLIKNFLSQTTSTFTIDYLFDLLSEIEKSFTIEKDASAWKIEMIKAFGQHHINKINTDDELFRVIYCTPKLAGFIHRQYLQYNSRASIGSLSYLILNDDNDDSDSEKKFGFIINFISNKLIEPKPSLKDLMMLVIKSDLLNNFSSENGMSNAISDIRESYCNQKKLLSEKISVCFEMADILYPQDNFLKASWLISVFKENAGSKNDDKDQSVKIIKDFINMKDIDRDLFSGIIETLRSKEYFTNGDILNLTRDKSKLLYPSVYELFDSIKNKQKNDSKEIHQFSFEQYLTPAGSKNVIKILTEEFLVEQINNNNEITITDIFSYFDTKGELAKFITFLNPETLNKLKENFKPSTKLLLVSPNEKEVLDQLLGKEPVIINSANQQIESVVEEKFISNRILCNYFAKKLKRSTSGFIYENQPLNFSINVHEYDELNNAFTHIMEISKRTDPYDYDEELQEDIDFVAEFFKRVFSIDISNIDDGKEKIFDFFKDNHNNLAYALTSEKIGIKKFSDRALGSALNDGRSKNIGSIFTTILYELILENELKRSTSGFIYENQPLNFSINVHEYDELNNAFTHIMEISKRTDPYDYDEELQEDIDFVAEFFKRVFSIDISNIDDGKEKIFDFFKDNHNNLAYALTSEKIGIKKFSDRALGSALNDGCSKNIGSIFTTILYELILENELKRSTSGFIYENQPLNFSGNVHEYDELNNAFTHIMEISKRTDPYDYDEELQEDIDFVAEFFERVFSIDISNIDDGKEKIFDFFKDNHNNLAYALTSEKIGIKKFSDRALGSALNDGRSKNIGSIFTTILYELILENELKRSTSGFIYENQPLNFSINVHEYDELNNAFTHIMEISKRTDPYDYDEELQKDIDFVAEFFKRVFSIDISNIDDGKEKIFDFFKDNHNNLAYALTSEKIGIKKFSDRALGSALNDGCSKNIGSIFTTILYELILENDFDKTLYSLLSNKIIPDILNSGGDLIGNANDPLANERVLEYYISPNVFLKEIAASKGYDFIKKSIIESTKCCENSAISALELLSNDINDIDNYNNTDNDIDLDLVTICNREQENGDNLMFFLLSKNIQSEDQNDMPTAIIKELEKTVPYDKIVALWEKMIDVASKKDLEKNPTTTPSEPKVSNGNLDQKNRS